MGNPTGAVIYKKLPVANGIKPDLNPSAGIALNPIPQLSVVVFAQRARSPTSIPRRTTSRSR